MYYLAITVLVRRVHPQQVKVNSSPTHNPLQVGETKIPPRGS